MLLQPPPQGVRAADVDDAVAGVAHLVHTRIVPVRLHRAAAEIPPRCRREWHVSPPLGMATLLVESSTTERSANSALTQGLRREGRIVMTCDPAIRERQGSQGASVRGRRKRSHVIGSNAGTNGTARQRSRVRTPCRASCRRFPRPASATAPTTCRPSLQIRALPAGDPTAPRLDPRSVPSTRVVRDLGALPPDAILYLLAQP